MPHRRRRVWLAVLLLAVLAVPAQARDILRDTTCHLPADAVVEGTLFALCRDLLVEGHVRGNLVAAAANTEIHGRVDGAVYLLGGQGTISGAVGRGLHFGGVALAVAPETRFTRADADVFALAMSTTLGARTYLPGSVTVAGYQLRALGHIADEVNFWGAALDVLGSVGGDVYATVGNNSDIDGTAQLQTLLLALPFELELATPGLRLMDTGRIDGALAYAGPTPAELYGVVGGEVAYTPVLLQPPLDLTQQRAWGAPLGGYLVRVLQEASTLIAVGILGLALWPPAATRPLEALRRRPLTSLGAGTLTFILSFPVFVFALVLGLGLMFGLALFQLGNLALAALALFLVVMVGGLSLFSFTAIFWARALVCLALGRFLLRPARRAPDGTTRPMDFRSLILGAVLISLAVQLPAVGWLVNAAALFFGLGAIVNVLLAQARRLREVPVAEPVLVGGVPRPVAVQPRFGTRAIAVPSPPGTATYADEPLLDPRARPTGTSNLPPGFVWWDDEPTTT